MQTGFGIDPAIIEQLLRDIYAGNTPSRELFNATARTLIEGVLKGYGKNWGNVNQDSPDFGMLSELSYNAGTFAAFKKHHQVKAMVALLKDENGNLRSFTDFKTEALKLDALYNQTWLKTEYDQAITAATMARKWQDAQRTAHLYPNLQYIAVMDDRTRQLHRAWHGVILPINHKFWNTHYPPNDWGCRCTVRRTDKPVDGKGLDVEDMPELPKQFNINVGKEGKVFNDAHPYFKTREYKDVAKAAKLSLFKLVQKDIIDFAKQLKPHPIKGAEELVSYGGDGMRKLMFENNKKPDWYSTAQLVYQIKELVKGLPFVFEEKLERHNEGVLGRYVAYKEINGVTYEVVFRKTVSATTFYYIKPKK